MFQIKVKVLACICCTLCPVAATLHPVSFTKLTLIEKYTVFFLKKKVLCFYYIQYFLLLYLLKSAIPLLPNKMHNQLNSVPASTRLAKWERKMAIEVLHSCHLSLH